MVYPLWDPKTPKNGSSDSDLLRWLISIQANLWGSPKLCLARYLNLSVVNMKNENMIPTYLSLHSFGKNRPTIYLVKPRLKISAGNTERNCLV